MSKTSTVSFLSVLLFFAAFSMISVCPKAKADTRIVQVPGTAGGTPETWVDTGVSLAAEQSVTMSATGLVGWDTGAPGLTTGPDGASWWKGPMENATLPGAYVGALIGKIGTGPIFLVGSGPKIATGEGELFLAVNDNGPDAYWNNFGSFTVTIEFHSGLQGDLWIESIEPVQTHVNPQIMICGKPTVFKVTLVSTFPDRKEGIYLNITCGNQWWIEGPCAIEANQETVIYTGGKETATPEYPCYRPSGEFDVTIKVDAFNKVQESDENNNEYTKHIGSQNGYSFKNLGRLKVLYVPVGFWGGPNAWLFGDPQIPSDDMTRETTFSDSFIKAVFPVDTTLYKSEIAAKYPLPCPYSIDPWSRRGWAAGVIYELNSAIKLYHQLGMGGYDRIVLVVPDRDGELWLKYWLNKDAFGMTLLKGDLFSLFAWDTVCWCQEGYWTTPAHELWHTYSHILDESWHCPNCGIGYWDQAHTRGSCGLIDRGLSVPCMMSGGDVEHGDPSWACRWICPQCYANLTNLPRFKICVDPEVLFVSGIVFDNDTTNLQPFYYFSEGYADLEPGNTGNYTLRFLDANQQVLSDIGFNVTFELDFNVSGFGFAVPYPHDVAQIQILHGETVVASRNVSANAPTVNITYPNDSAILTSGDNVTIQWEAYDADNDPLSYSVLYTPDNGSSWIPVRTGVTETSLDWTVPNDHPIDQCRIKVVATDGVNTGEVISNNTFTILRHDVSAAEVTASKTVVGESYTFPVNVTVQNCGNYSETANLEVYANTTLIYTQSLTLTQGNSTTISCTCNTSGLAKGSYIIKAILVPVTGETDTTDNTVYYDKMLAIGIPGDVNGDTVVDSTDLGILGSAWGSFTGDSLHIPEADINDDGVADSSDLGIMGAHWGETE